MKFKIGDTIIGNKFNTYGLTREGVVCEVTNTKTRGPRDIEVRKPDGTTKYWVESRYFDLHKKKKIDNWREHLK